MNDFQLAEDLPILETSPDEEYQALVDSQWKILHSSSLTSRQTPPEPWIGIPVFITGKRHTKARRGTIVGVTVSEDTDTCYLHINPEGGSSEVVIEAFENVKAIKYVSVLFCSLNSSNLLQLLSLSRPVTYYIFCPTFFLCPFSPKVSDLLRAIYHFRFNLWS